MDQVTLARLHGLGRIAVGGAFVLAPERAGAGWVGDEAKRPGAQVLGIAFGVRDAAIGAGVLATAGSDAARPWLLAGVVSDAVDLTASLRGREAVPSRLFPGVVGLAVFSAALGAYLAARS